MTELSHLGSPGTCIYIIYFSNFLGTIVTNTVSSFLSHFGFYDENLNVQPYQKQQVGSLFIFPPGYYVCNVCHSFMPVIPLV